MFGSVTESRAQLAEIAGLGHFDLGLRGNGGCGNLGDGLPDALVIDEREEAVFHNGSAKISAENVSVVRGARRAVRLEKK